MELKVGAMTAAGLGSLFGLMVSRPTSLSEALTYLAAGAATAQYLGPEVARLIHFSEGAATFLVGLLGVAAIRVVNTLVTKFSSDPFAAIDRLVSAWFNRGASATKQEG